MASVNRRKTTCPLDGRPRTLIFPPNRTLKTRHFKMSLSGVLRGRSQIRRQTLPLKAKASFGFRRLGGGTRLITTARSSLSLSERSLTSIKGWVHWRQHRGSSPRHLPWPGSARVQPANLRGRAPQNESGVLYGKRDLRWPGSQRLLAGPSGQTLPTLFLPHFCPS